MLYTHESNQINPGMNGEKVKVAGWANNIRALGKIAFIKLRDKNGLIQITILKGKNPELYELIENLTLESVLLVEGEVKESKQAQNGFEIIPSKIEILSKSEATLPLDLSGKIESNLDTRLDWRSIDLRDPKHRAIFKIQSALVQGMQEYLFGQDFEEVFLPAFIGVPSESGADVFKIDFFGKDAFLRQDPQLHRELAIAGGFTKLFELGPSWRAEPSHTTRHLCEHRGCAPEIAFIESEEDTMRLEEQVIVAGFKKVKDNCREELELLEAKIEIPKTPFPQLRFPKIYEILEGLGKKIEFGKEYDTESEKLLGEYVKKKYKNDFFFVNRFPYAEKPFYVMRVDDDPQWARSVDLIYRGIEMSSGGQREHRYEKIIEQIKDKGMNPKNLKWFTEVFKYGVPPMGGFNVGIERLIKQMLDLENIREAALFPRDTKRAEP